MSVTLHTDSGDLKIEIFCDTVPRTAFNFLALAASGYYDGTLFHRNVKGFMLQGGDPTGTGTGGTSIYGELYGEQARFFEDEISRKLRHDKAGTVSMANTGPSTNGSQFFITASDGQNHLDDRYTTFGRVAEGLDVVSAISNAYADADGRPYQNLRIRHTIVLDDPFEDPPGLQVCRGPAAEPTYARSLPTP